MKSIVWSSIAADDLREIIDWLTQRASYEAAVSFIDRIDEEVGRLPEFPESGRIVPELERQNIFQYREVILAPWRVFYTEEADRILILAVIDGRRNVEDILLRRNLR